MIGFEQIKELGMLSDNDLDELKKANIMVNEEVFESLILQELMLGMVRTEDFTEYEIKCYREAYQDMVETNYPWATLSECRPKILPLSSEPTEEEIQYWQAKFKAFCEMNFDEARKRCKIDTDFVPYNEWD